MGKGARRPSRGRNKAHQLYTPPRFNRFLPRAKCSHSWFINHRRFSPKRFSPQSPRSRRLATCRSAPKTTDVHFRCVNAQLRSPPNSRPCGSTCLSPPSHTHTQVDGKLCVCVRLSFLFDQVQPMSVGFSAIAHMFFLFCFPPFLRVWPRVIGSI